MDYAAALKKVRETKVKPNYLSIKMGYERLVLPYADGIQVMAALANAEQFKDQYNDKARIAPIDVTLFETAILSGHEYEQYKIAALLNVPIKDVKEMETAS
jgi:hypothetical protein